MQFCQTQWFSFCHFESTWYGMIWSTCPFNSKIAIPRGPYTKFVASHNTLIMCWIVLNLCQCSRLFVVLPHTSYKLLWWSHTHNNTDILSFSPLLVLLDTHPLYHALHRFDVLHKDHLSHRSVTKAFRELHFSTLDRCVCVCVCTRYTVASCSYLLAGSHSPLSFSLYQGEEGERRTKGTRPRVL